ncbi:hypothetical protein, partial [Marinobacter sp. X15-166B]|uniref:hypothetical protein n=1 Tax=Marinobacter sp. X15-166B TaxID=1897620 RepID=UPI0013018ABD
MSMLACSEGLGIPSVSISKDHKASQALNRLVYTVPVRPSTSRVGLMGDPVEELVDCLGVASKRYREAATQALSVILYNVYRLERDVSPDPHGLYALALPRRAQGFTVPMRYKVNQIGRKLWCKVIDALVAGGFLEVALRGFKGKEHMAGLTSLYYPTEAFLFWLDQVEGRLRTKQFDPNAEQLVLKSVGEQDRRKRLVDYQDCEMTRQLRRQVQFISEVFQSHQVQAWVPRELSMKDVPSPLLAYRRHFRDDFTKGGRVFCPLQSTPSTLRKSFRFDGKQVVELDYSSHQPRMCYHLQGLQAPEDCYAHPTIPRALIKAATTRIMNCRNTRQARASIQVLLNEEWSEWSDTNGMTAEVLLDAVFQLHPIIKELMGKNLWMTLQYLESSIALSIMERLAQDDLPCLGIHDSFVVAVDVEDQLHQ